MKRLLAAAAALVCACGLTLDSARAQTTTITATNEKIGGYLIPTGTVTFTPVDMLGNPISFADATGAANGPVAFECAITSGVITGMVQNNGTTSGTCAVPDATLTTPANIRYTAQVCDTSTGNRTSGKCFTQQSIIGISGSSWPLDHYGPPLTIPALAQLYSSTGTTTPGSCVGPTLFYNSSTNILNVCVGGVYVPVLSAAPSIAGLPLISNLIVEYAMNEGTGTVLHDLSGNGNNGTINGATWESTTDLNFGTLGNYASVPAAVAPAKSLAFAIYFPPFTTPYNTSQKTYGPPVNYAVSSEYSPSFYCGLTSPGDCFLAMSLGQNNRSMRMYNYPNATESQEGIPAGWHTVILACGDGVSAKGQIFIDGQEVGGYVNQAISYCGNGTSVMQLGGSAALTSASYWVGKMAFFAAWNTLLNNTTAAQAHAAILNYIHAKGVVTEYRNVASLVPAVYGGTDSRSCGYVASPSWVTSLSLTDGTYSINSICANGTTLYDHATQFDLLWGKALASNAPAIAIFWGGVNDFENTTETPRQVADYLKTMVRKAKALGARVIVATEIDAAPGGSGNGQTGKDALDPIIRAEAIVSWGADNIADLAEFPNIGADGAYSNTTYFPDGLHPNLATQTAYITPTFSNAVNELLGSSETSHHTTASTSYQELAGDRFLDLLGTSAQTITLVDCLGYSLPRLIVNDGTATATLATLSSETLVGSTSIAVGATAKILPIPGAVATGGCSWRRVQ